MVCIRESGKWNLWSKWPLEYSHIQVCACSHTLEHINIQSGRQKHRLNILTDANTEMKTNIHWPKNVYIHNKESSQGKLLVKSSPSSEHWGQLYISNFMRFTWVILHSLLKWWMFCFHGLSVMSWLHYHRTWMHCTRLSLLTLEPRIVLPTLHCSHHWHLMGPDYCFLFLRSCFLHSSLPSTAWKTHPHPLSRFR